MSLFSNISDLSTLIFLNFFVFVSIAAGYFLWKKMERNSATSIPGTFSDKNLAWENLSRSLFSVNSTMVTEEALMQLLKVVSNETNLEYGMLTKSFDNKNYEVISTFGSSPPWAAGEKFPSQSFYCSRLMCGSEPLCIDYAGVSEWRNHEAYKSKKIESYMGVPVYVGNDFYGVLSVFGPKTKANGFSSKEQTLIQAAAGWVGVILAKELAVGLEKSKVA